MSVQPDFAGTRPSVRLPDGSEATLFATAVEALFMGFTEPIREDDLTAPRRGDGKHRTPPRA